MQELRHDSDQVIVVGVFLEKKNRGYPIVPYSGLKLNWCYWRYLVKADGTVVDIISRTWNDVPNCSGLYYLTLISSDVCIRGPLTLYIHDDNFLGKPFKKDYSVINKNVYDAKYGNDLLKVLPDPFPF